MDPAEDPYTAVDWHRKWEKNPPPPRAKDPPRIEDHQEKRLNLGTTFLLDQKCTSNTPGKGLIHIEVESKCWVDKLANTEVVTKVGLSTTTSLTKKITILCGTLALLQLRSPGPQLIDTITEAYRTQEALEDTENHTSSEH